MLKRQLPHAGLRSLALRGGQAIRFRAIKFLLELYFHSPCF